MKNSPQDKGLYFLTIVVLVFLTFIQSATAQSPSKSELPKEIRTVLAKAGEDTVKINILLNLANQVQQKDPVLALTCCFYALRLAREVPSESHIDQALLRIGKFLFQGGVYEEAMSYYQEYYQRALKSGNKLNQLKVRHNIVALKLSVNDKYDKAIHDEMQSLLKDYEALWEQSGDTVIVKEMIPGLLINLSQLVMLNGDMDEANTMLQRGFDLNARYKIPTNSVLQLLLADFTLKSKMGKFQEAYEQASYAREICKESGNLVMLTAFEYYSGNALAQQGALEEAVEAYLSAFSQAERLGIRSVQVQAASKLSEIYQKNGNLEEALRYGNSAQKIQAAMKKNEAITKVAQSEMLEKIHTLEEEVKADQRARSMRLILTSALFLAVISLGYFLLHRTRRKYKKVKLEKADYALKVQKTVEEKGALEIALEAKDKQLAAETMYRVQKNEIIREVVQKLYAAQWQQKKDTTKELSEAIKGLERAMDNDSWEDFELRFLQVHQGFYDRLQELHPKLTTNERRMCAFLKLGMNSKEISALTGQSVKSIVMARHRLRKKLELPEPETSLVEFFADF